jgi:SAM-dependent methyltransferase
MTARMLRTLGITSSDRIVEFAPGLGDTARRLAASEPFSYIGVDRDEGAVRRLRHDFETADWMQFVEAAAESTGLPDESATVVIAEAMLSMQSADTKRRIVQEAARLLAQSGRYAIHELCLADPCRRAALEAGLSREIHSGIRLLTAEDWHDLLTESGFRVRCEFFAPMHLLEPARVLADEGLLGTLRILRNLARDPEARSRVISMRRTFAAHARELCAICLIAEKE